MSRGRPAVFSAGTFSSAQAEKRSSNVARVTRCRTAAIELHHGHLRRQHGLDGTLQAGSRKQEGEPLRAGLPAVDRDHRTLMASPRRLDACLGHHRDTR